MKYDLLSIAHDRGRQFAYIREFLCSIKYQRPVRVTDVLNNRRAHACSKDKRGVFFNRRTYTHIFEQTVLFLL